MGESPHSTTSLKTKQTSHAVLMLATTALDTTWRTLVPGIVGTVLGLVLDHAWHTTPIVMSIGLVLGIALSVLLVSRQFKALNR